jgi:addiction module RelE/StbE family toxin
MMRIYKFLESNGMASEKIQDLFEQFYQDILKLNPFPEIGAQLKSKVSINNDYRYILSGDYIILYRVVELKKTIRILHVYHQKQNYITQLKLK